MRLLVALFRWVFLILGGASLAALIFGFGIVLYYLPGLPDVEQLKEVRLQVPLRVLSADGKLIAEFGEKRRIPLTIDQIPLHLKQAVIAAEDDRFYEHPGVDYQGLMRAALNLASTGTRAQGGSTITMQVARNFFLDNERTYSRKLREILLALQIEKNLNKDEILSLYLNRNYMGNRAYGVGAAAELYYGKSVNDLTLAEVAMLAGLYKAPSKFNPLANKERARLRRDYVLRRMQEQRYITLAEAEAAMRTEDGAELHGPKAELDADYVAEMVRVFLFEKYGEDVYGMGLTVRTTLDSQLQTAAVDTLRRHILDYDVNHGYRGAEAKVTLPADRSEAALNALLTPYSTHVGLVPALVLDNAGPAASLYLGRGRWAELPYAGVKWARRFKDENNRGARPASVADAVQPGDIIRVRQRDGEWELAQMPKVGGALVSLSPQDGKIVSLVGGFDYFVSRFNRATQALRQPGSSFKPFVYSAALQRGSTLATVFNDAPVVFFDENLGRDWRPENYSQEFYGPTRLRVALAKSRNLVSIRLLQQVGIGNAIRHVERFKMSKRPLPRDLSLSLGTGELTPLELTSGFAVFANGGYRVEPYFISSVTDLSGKVLYQHEPALVCEQPPCPVAEPERAISAQNAWQMTSMMQDVIRVGTATRARSLKRTHVAGKTGTTNDQRDAWFAGYTRDYVTTVWMGFDAPRPLGKKETGGKLALPVWIDYMQVALEGLPDRAWDKPSGMVTVRIDPESGLRAVAGNPAAIMETFESGRVPPEQPSMAVSIGVGGAKVPEQLF